MTKEIVKYFLAKYKELYEDNYPIVWPREMKIAKDLLASYDADKLKKYLDIYFTMSNDFIDKAGHKLQLLRSQIPAIQAQIRKERKEIVAKTSDADKIAEAAKTLEIKGDF